MLRIAIVDDNQEYLEQIVNVVSNTLKAELKEYQIDPYKSAVELESQINMGRSGFYDVYLMDIEMPEMNGLELAQLIRERYAEPYIIFITSHERYSIEAFEYQAFYYVVKDRLEEMLVPAICKIVKRMAERVEPFYLINTTELYQKVYYKDIYYIDVKKKYTYFHTPEAEAVKKSDSDVDIKMPRVRESLKNVYNHLEDHQMFIFIDQNCLVNLMHVMRIDRKNQMVILRDGTRLWINNSRLKAFNEAIVAYAEARG